MFPAVGWHPSTRQDSDLVHDHPDYCEITCADPSRFKQWPASEAGKMIDLVNEAASRVERGDLPQNRFLEIQQMVGFSANPHGVMADPVLREGIDFLSATTYDWVHSMLADGLLTTEIEQLLRACTHITPEAIREWLADGGWVFPSWCRAKCKQICRVFDPCRQPRENKEAGFRLKASCSELLTLYSLLRHFLDLHPPVGPVLAGKRDSFHWACTALDEILQCKRGDTTAAVAAPRVQSALTQHSILHQREYGTRTIRPKHHWMLDIPSQIARDQLVIDCFVIERQHLLVKGIAEHVDNLSSYERTVLSGVCTAVFQDHNAVLADGLVGHKARLPGSPSVLIGDKTRIMGTTIAIDDMVLCSTGIGMVVAIAEEHGTNFVVVDVLERGVPVTERHCSHRLTGGRQLWPVSAVSLPVAWYRLEDGAWVVLT